jgi:hypothetical protein
VADDHLETSSYSEPLATLRRHTEELPADFAPPAGYQIPPSRLAPGEEPPGARGRLTEPPYTTEAPAKNLQTMKPG